MLQKAQLDEVASRYRGETAELRVFLTRAGVATGTGAALGQVASRVQADRAFRRDLMSHVWVLLDAERAAGELPVTTADVLGVVAVAAAGASAAAEADEAEAHTLLRFVMDSRHAFAASASKEVPVALRPPETELRAAAPERDPELERVSATERASSREVSTTEPSVASARPERRNRGPMFAGLIAACGLVAAVIGYGLLYRAPNRNQSAATGSVGSPAVIARSVPERTPQAVPSGEALPLDEARVGAGVGTELRAGTPRRPIRENEAPLAAVRPAPVVNGIAPEAGAPIFRSEPGPQVAALAPPVSSVVARGNGAAISLGSQKPLARASTVPASVLSRELDSPALPAYASDPAYDAGNGRKYPRLLRRHSTSAVASDNGKLLAEMRVPNIAGAGNSGRGMNAPQTAVQATCVGMMAGNLVYGPAPAYPAEAAAQRVQGEVKIQATVDRDGSVTSARVVSGPPLLRDAALDAVQRWRYKPFVAAGRPTPTGTTAVMEFQLQ